MALRLKKFFKEETVLCIAALLAIVSAFFVVPNKQYISYIDFKTLAVLFCLMAVVAGLEKDGAFEFIANKLLKRVSNTRQLSFILVILCFISSMLITNDVALITFVPFTILILSKANHKEMIIYTVVMQTIAANLGSVLLPVGNPQNLYLYGLADMDFGKFVWFMAPIWLASLVLLIITLMPVKKHDLSVKKSDAPKLKKTYIYMVLFALCLLSVAGVLPYYILFGIIFVSIFAIDRPVLKKVDYMLLITFVCFFIFIGNMKNIQAVSDMLKELIEGRSFVAGVVSSQFISNVPAAILLSGFTDDIKAILWGTDIGGLGTLIASMASLISFKIYIKQEEHDGKKYFAIFTAMNLLFLAVLILLAVVFM